MSWSSTALANKVYDWANGVTANYGMKIAADEATTCCGKQLYSRETSAPSVLSVTYNTAPNTITGRFSTPSVISGSTTYVSSTTPTLHATAFDPDGGTTQPNFELFNSTGTLQLTPTSNIGLAAQSLSRSWQVPSSAGLSNGNTYEWRAKGFDGTNSSAAYSTWVVFTVDALAPTTTTIASSAYPANTWTTSGATPTFTVAATDIHSGVDHYLWALDSSNPTTPFTGTTLTLPQIPDGWHSLYVRAVDKAGNVGPVSSAYNFGTVPAVTSPVEGAVTNQLVQLTATAPTTATQASFYYRRAAADGWSPVPAADVTGTGFTSWPYSVSIGSNGAKTAALSWNLAGTSSLNATDGPVQVGVCFGPSSTCTSAPGTTLPVGASSAIPVNAALDQKQFGTSQTSSVGVAEVNLVTGNAQLSANDVSVPGGLNTSLSVGRTLNTATVGSTSGIFGPGWTASLPVDSAGSDWTALTDSGAVLTAKGSDQSTVAFAKKQATDTVWYPTGQDSDTGLKLTDSTSVPSNNCSGYRCYTLTDLDGVTVVFQSAQASPPTGTLSSPVAYTLSRVLEPGNPTATTFTTIGGGLLPTRVLSPTPAGSTCTDPTSSATWTPGCRALDLSYDQTSTPSTSKLLAATYSVNPGSGAVQVDVGCWAYNGPGGRLSDVWDPRDIATAATGTHPIGCNPAAMVRPTHYDYDSGTGLPTKVTPAYAATGSPLAGSSLTFTGTKLTSVVRAHLIGSAAETTNIVYGVPLTADGSHPEYRPDLTTAASWGQIDTPAAATGGTAICPPGSSPSSPTAAGDLRDCTINYLDANGRAVNTATYSGSLGAGWHISTTEYDALGHTIRTLTAANREEALTPNTGAGKDLGLPSDTALAAQQLSTISIYSPNSGDSQPDLTDTYGPYHQAIIPGSSTEGQTAKVRTHTHLTYDNGTETLHPSGGPLHLVLTTTVGASQNPDPVATNEVDQRVSQNVYAVGTDDTGWTYRSPLKTIADPSGLNLVNTVLLDPPTGRVIQTSLPTDVASGTPGATAGTTKTVYYTTAAVTGSDSDLRDSASPGRATVQALPGEPHPYRRRAGTDHLQVRVRLPQSADPDHRNPQR